MNHHMDNPKSAAAHSIEKRTLVWLLKRAGLSMGDIGKRFGIFNAPPVEEMERETVLFLIGELKKELQRKCKDCGAVSVSVNNEYGLCPKCLRKNLDNFFARP